MSDILNPSACVLSAQALGRSRGGDEAYSQSEGDRPHGCRVQTFGPPLWVNDRASSKAKSSDVHQLFCRMPYFEMAHTGTLKCADSGMSDIMDPAACVLAAQSLGKSRGGDEAYQQSE